VRNTIFDSSMINILLHWLSSLFLKVLGWRKAGELPAVPKYVLIGAPHTSNWDFPITLAYAFAYKIKVFWLAKHTIFRKPFGGLLTWLGGIPIDRTKSHNVVSQSIQLYNALDKLIMVVSPEGTRKKVTHWKTGFYHIASGANVPIFLGFLDFRRKLGGFGPMIIPTGDIGTDMKKIRRFYATIRGKHHDRMSSATVTSDSSPADTE
jgi:1-acyl-sn-glycerol-3-phosphate acyltransferase